MKKIFLSIATLFLLSMAVNAQTTEGAKADQQLSKEAKAELKKKQNQQMEDAMKQAGFTTEEIAKFKETNEQFGAKNAGIKKNTALSEEEKQAQLKANNDQKNAELKKIVGDEKYKEFNKIKKEHKEAAGSSAQ